MELWYSVDGFFEVGSCMKKHHPRFYQGIENPLDLAVHDGRRYLLREAKSNGAGPEGFSEISLDTARSIDRLLYYVARQYESIEPLLLAVHSYALARDRMQKERRGTQLLATASRYSKRETLRLLLDLAKTRCVHDDFNFILWYLKEGRDGEA